jgi:hypothetical protein
MLVEAMDASAAAYHVGYFSRSQFTREYSRLFGAPPFRDVKQIRQQSQPAELRGLPCGLTPRWSAKPDATPSNSKGKIYLKGPIVPLEITKGCHKVLDLAS